MGLSLDLKTKTVEIDINPKQTSTDLLSMDSGNLDAILIADNKLKSNEVR